MTLTNVLFAVATRIFVIVEISGAASSGSELSSRYDHDNVGPDEILSQISSHSRVSGAGSEPGQEAQRRGQSEE